MGHEASWNKHVHHGRQLFIMHGCCMTHAVNVVAAILVVLTLVAVTLVAACGVMMTCVMWGWA